ncbi:MAG: hypothetical protein ACI8XV_003091 [Arenicella sp.]|jgi:hypothetical protein
MKLIALCIIFGAMTGCASNNNSIPEISFDLETCMAIAEDPAHPYHNNEFVVSGCNHVLTDIQERAMYQRSLEGPEKPSSAD